MGEGERDRELSIQGGDEMGVQRVWLDETGDYATRDDWIEGIFQMGNVPDLNDRKDDS